jgi:NO-binding membrane sensor protein with MHYT domain
MHYLGMRALEVPGRDTWSMDLVVASIAAGMTFGLISLAIAVRVLGAGPPIYNDICAGVRAQLRLPIACVASG